MPPVPVPPEVDAFLARPNPAVVATVSPTGAPHTAATWYDWEDGRVLLNMDESRLRLRYMRQNPAVALTVLGEDSWYAQITLLGRVVSIEDDPDLARHRPALHPLLRQAVPQQGRAPRHCVDGAGPLVELASSSLSSSVSTTQSGPSPHSSRGAPSTSVSEVASTRTGLPSSSSSAPRVPPADIA